MKKQFILLLTALMLAMPASAYAITTEQKEENTVVLSGNAEKAGEKVALDVFVADKSRNDVEDMKKNGEKLTDVWVTHLETDTNDEGDFEFSFDVALPSGRYTAYLGTRDKQFEPYTFAYVSNEDFIQMAKIIKTVDADRLEQIITDKSECYVIGISEEEAKAVNVKDFAVVLQKTLNTLPFSGDNRDEAWLTVDKAYFVQMLNESKIADIYKEEEKVTGFADSGIAEYYKKYTLSNNFAADFTKRLSGRSFGSYSAYKEALPEAFVLTMVKNPSGVGDVEEIVKAFQGDIGISITSSTPATVWNKLAGNDYANYAALKNAFDSYVRGGSGIGSSGSPGGGGSSGSVGIKASVPATGNSVNSVPNPSIPVNIFDDIEDVEWARDAIVTLAEKSIVSGIGGGKFNPNGNVTREQFTKIVVGAFVPEAEIVALPFKDVSADAWYTEYIAKAYGKEIVGGMGDGSFGVGMNITRQDMCVMIYNAARALGMNFELSEDTFADDSLISDYAKEAVYALKKAGAVNGINNDEFGPLGFATRAQAAKIIYFLIQ